MITMDTTRPNISRVYDYILGGHHNFEVDRAVAQQILRVVPSYPVWCRMNRWFLQLVAREWSSAGYRHILDLGSGMPTQDHFHAVASEAKILYCDSDPYTVAYAREVIGASSRVHYLEHDIRDMGPVLAAAAEHFGAERSVAVGMIGVSYFFDDATLAQMMHDLYAWTAPGSIMAISFLHTTADAADQQAVLDAISRLNITAYPRTPDEMTSIVAPWRVRELRPLSVWLGVENPIDPNDLVARTIEVYGAILER